MLAAIVSLLGALAGVAIGAALTEFRDMRRDQQVRRDEAAVAARLVLHELQTSRSKIIAANGAPAHAENHAWREHLRVLARQMDEGGWGAVARGYAELELAAAQAQPLTETSQQAVKRSEARLRAPSDWARDSR